MGVVYSGDKKLARPLPRGNSKNPTPFIRTIGSTLRALKEKSNKTSIKQRYDELKQDAVASVPDCLEPEKVERYVDHVAPKNPKQVKNHKYAQRAHNRLTQDNIFNLYVLAKTELKEYVYYFRWIPDILAIFCHPESLNCINRLISLASSGDGDHHQIISYDTTFNLTDIYVSVLVACNTELIGDKIFPIVFMIHDRKYSEVHEFFWDFLTKKSNSVLLCP